MKIISEIGFKKAISYLFWTIFLVLFRFMIFSPLRVFFLRLFGARIGRGTVILSVRLFNVYYNGLSNLEIGDYCFLGDEAMLDLASKIHLEPYTVLANRVIVTTHMHLGYKNHPLQKYIPKKKEPVYFKRGCYVGVGAIILSGVTIGEGAVVGAGAVVTKSVPNWIVVVGVPAKKLRRIK